MDEKIMLTEPAPVGYCEHCLQPILRPFPVLPLWDLPTAAALIPMKLGSLKNWLVRHKAELAPAVYRKAAGKSMKRYLTSADIRLAREKSFYTRDHTGKLVTLIEGYNCVRNNE